MDSFEWNKIFGGVLAALLAIMVIREIAGILSPVEELETAAVVIEGVQASASGAEAAAAVVEEAPDFGALMQEASAEAGERVAALCTSCHGFDKGGANKVGPNLYNVFGGDIAAKDGFNYSSALQGKDGDWTYEKMYAYLEDPRGWAPGTLMAFAGLKRQRDRINVIAYMRQQTDAPVPLPEPMAAEAPEESAADAAAAEDGAAAEEVAPEGAAPEDAMPEDTPSEDTMPGAGGQTPQ